MTTITPKGRVLAIAAGAAFTYGGLRIILGDELLTNPVTWSTPVQLTVLMVLGTIAAGHLMRDAAGAKRFAAMAGFFVLFLAGTGLVVFNSVGRQAETSMLTEAQADFAADERARIKPLLEQAELMLSGAAAKINKDCVHGKASKAACDGLRATHNVYEAAVKGHMADLERIGPPKPVNAKATQGAKIAALFGADEVKAKAALILIEPFLWTLFFEWGSIVSLGFAFRGARAITETAPGEISDAEIEEFKKITSNDHEPLPPTRAIDPVKKGAEVIVWAKEFEKRHGRRPKLNEAEAAFENMARTTIYRRLTEAA